MSRAIVARRLAVANGAARCALGVVALVAPGVPLRPWVGPVAAGDPEARLLGRALGGRDLAIGLGTLRAALAGSPAQGWVGAAGLADAGDVAVTLAALRRRPGAGRRLVLAAASAGVAASLLTLVLGPGRADGPG